MRRLRATTRMRRVAAASLGLAALALVPAVASVGQTEAAWVNSEYATTTATAPTVTILKGTCVLSNPNINLAGNQVATASWSYPAASATVVQPNQIVYRITGPTGTVGAPATLSVGNGAPTSLALNVNNAAAGTYTVSFVPNRNAWATGSTASWDGPAITFSLVVSQNLTGRYFSSCA